MGALAGNDFFAYKALHGFPYGWSWFLMLFALCGLFCQLGMWPCFFKSHEKEEETDEREQLERDMAEDYMQGYEEDNAAYGDGAQQQQYGGAEYYGAEYGQQYGQQQQLPGQPQYMAEYAQPQPLQPQSALGAAVCSWTTRLRLSKGRRRASPPTTRDPKGGVA